MSNARARVGAAPPLAILAAGLAALAGCAGSDPQPLELLSLDRFGDQTSLVAGGGASSIVAHTAQVGGFPVLRIARHDPSTPDQLSLVGDVSFAGSGGITRLVVTEDAAAITVGGVVMVVDVTQATLPLVALPALGSASDLAVSGPWVLATVGPSLVLVSRDAPDATAAHVPSGAPTCLLATGGGFLAFTTTGYVVVDPSGATTTFTDATDATLADVRSAFPDGAGAVVAGPSTTSDRSRVLRLDLSTPASPGVVGGHEVPGTFAAFAWDGGSTSLVAIHGDRDGADPRTFHEGYLVREGAGGFTDAGVPLTFWSQSAEPLAAHADRLFAVEAQGLLFLRIR